MNTGMDFLQWTLSRTDYGVDLISCAEQYRSMAFAQLTYRESLRDRQYLSHGLPPTLCHRIHAALAQRDRSGLDLTNTVYALDSTTSSVPVGLSVGALPHHQGGGEDAHAARPAGQHSEFYPHLGWQAARRSCPRYALAGSRSHLRRGSWLRRLCPPLCVAPSRGLLRHGSRAHRVYSALASSTRPSPWRLLHPSGLRTSAPLQGPRVPNTICALYKSRWQVASSGSSSIFGSSSIYGTAGE